MMTRLLSADPLVVQSSPPSRRMLDDVLLWSKGPANTKFVEDAIISDTFSSRSGYPPIYKTVQFLFVSSFIYLVSGLWLGDQNIPCCLILFYGGLLLIVWWLLKDYIIKAVSSKKSKKLQMWVYCLIPWCRLSKCWGRIAGLYLPVMMRVYVYLIYSKCFGVNVKEIEYPLNHYTSLTAFFTRRLAKNARNINHSSCLVVPCDGTVVYCGRLFGKHVKQVKGIDYYVQNFLGYTPTISTIPKSKNEVSTRLFQCIIYLAPGDYHRFHSPCNWTVLKRSHFHGELLSVAPKLVRWFPNLLSVNERIVYSGRWKHGFFSYTAVGATNVGSVIVHKDTELNTNKSKAGATDHITFNSSDYTLSKGEEIGMFAMGSTIVLLFEAPETFEFTRDINDKVKFGSQFGMLKKCDLDGCYAPYVCNECNANSPFLSSAVTK